MLYDSSYSEIESLIARCAPLLMRNAAALPEDEDRGVRPEKRPKSTWDNRTGYSTISPEMSATIMSMQGEGRGLSQIAHDVGLHVETVKYHIRKKGVKNTAEETSALRRGPYSGVTMVRTK